MYDTNKYFNHTLETNIIIWVSSADVVLYYVTMSETEMEIAMENILNINFLYIPLILYIHF